jgi:tRNA A37 methylthiotransferase MiaB
MKGEINGLVSKERMSELTDLISANNLDFRQKHKVPLEVLIESEKEGIYTGLDQFFNRIEVECEHDLSGNWITIEEYETNEEANYVRL